MRAWSDELRAYANSKSLRAVRLDHLKENNIATAGEITEGALTDNYHTIAIVARDAFLRSGESADEALARLREGNSRFVAEIRSHDSLASRERRNELAGGQEPFAIILGCSDSRVPAEIIFDQGLGDLFVIRVAGNIVAPSQVGSVEFAAERYHTRLVVVLGHSQCGAILATLEELARPVADQSPNLRSIVDRIRPAVQELVTRNRSDAHDALVHQAVRANIRVSANQLRHGSEMLEQAIQKSGLMVVGAEYSLETGVVDFFDGVPQAPARQDTA